MTRPDDAWILDALADSAIGWSVGTFGAIAEFTRDPGESADLQGAEVTTARGAIRISPRPDMKPVAYETPNRDGETWSHAVALCLPADAAAMNRRATLTELGPDADAIRPQDRTAILFDMGLGTRQVDICIRTADADLIAVLRTALGRSLFEPGNHAFGAIVASGPHRAFVSRLGRAEVYQPIPAADGRSPDGPHTHVLPKLLRSGRTHAATTPIPDGLVPCAYVFPPNPVKDAMGRRKPFDADEHARFQALLAQHGEPETIRLKSAVSEALASGLDPTALSIPDSKHSRAVVRVALRQARVSGLSEEVVDRWSRLLDPLQKAKADDADEGDDADEQPAH